MGIRIALLSLCLVSGVAAAQVDLKGITGGSALPGLPSLDSSVTGNVAGTLQYCLKNNYLSADAASGVKDKLLAKVPGQGDDYKKGEQGVLTGSDGKTLNMTTISSKLRRKACDQVLRSAKSLI
ncbi:DUF2501 domain-containing protein [Lysobacter sp. LF1]|uniref:DUF2501 domain-containing protein n=1 Tax=Lysobacter stagni TaxID=3045172 RepID=A0ABT6XFY2_9GAMM|nr:DUF2501 domain-containing protein [Lysobacter sp. LF1]MDI9239052.1 DUF2501 domain-containing protein [Lysobacter sp. LF1]